MKVRVPSSASSPLMWFAVGGSPVAWGLQFGVSYWITYAHCDQATGGWTDASQALVIVITIIAAAVALAAGLAALALFRATRETEDDDAPPAGRTHFLAIIGMAITPLFIFIIVMNGVGAGISSPCHTS